MNRTRHFSAIISLIAAASLASATETLSSAGPKLSHSSSPTTTTTAAAPSHYTTVKGDTLLSVAHQFACSSRSLRKLNHLKSSRLHVGTMLEIPAPQTAAARRALKNALATTASKKPAVLSASEQHRLALQEALRATDKYSRHAPIAQPVQDFDLSPSNFASCPTPPSNAQETNFAAAGEDAVAAAAPPATVSPEPSYPEPLALQGPRAGLLPVPATLPTPQEETTPKTFTANHSGSISALPSAVPTTVHDNASAVLAATVAPKKSFASALADFFGGSSHGLSASEAGEWGNRFLTETRNLAAQGVCYDGSWRPDGESHRWEMDCSNTTRYLYQVTAGIQLPRTASDQYYYLHLQDKAWDVPMTAAGFADCNFLRNNLKPGDLLFWENTYRPDRQPPITHVMIFLGSDARGRWLMAGSQGSRGMYNRRHSGPDVYVFNPTHAVGGYTTWLGLVRHHGRFVAYGRPLEADVKKLSVAAND